MLKIGEFAKRGNVSIRALRFYHEAGLLEPLRRSINPLQELRAPTASGFARHPSVQSHETFTGGDSRAQAQQTFENLKAALEASGAKFENVVKLNYYFSDITQLSVVREVRDKFINVANPPASTAVEVKRLFREPFLIEVEGVAVVPE